jgi:transposase-like protein
MRNVMAKAPRRLQARLGRELSRIFAAECPAEAKQRTASLKKGLGTQLPEAMTCLDAGLVAATQFFAFPKAHWQRLRSTNGVERLNAEIKRRTRVVGSFPDQASARRLISAVCLINLAEGSGRAGGDRLHCFTIALGSLREVSAVLEIAAAHGWLTELPCAAQRHRLGGMIYALARR